MTNLEIKREIDLKNQLLNTILTPNSFTLNNTIVEISQEISELQKQCTHSFVDGYCEYCYKEN